MEKPSANRLVVIQPRDRKVMEMLNLLRFLDVYQMCDMGLFHSASRAKTRLLALTRAGYIDRLFVGTIKGGRKAVYHRMADRKRRATRPITSAQTEHFVDHQLALNRIYILLSRTAEPLLSSWRRGTKAIPDAQGIVPDAIVTIRRGGTSELYFLELDLGSESGTVWSRKVREYLRLARSGYTMIQLGFHSFRVLVVARDEDRIRVIRKVIARSTDKVFRLANTSIISRDGFWSANWLRPTGDQKHPL